MSLFHTCGIATLCLAWLNLLAAVLPAQETGPPLIAVSGTAEIRVVPDYAVLRFSIDSRALQLESAVKDNDAKVVAVTRFLSESNIESRFVRTELIRIRPIFQTQTKASQGQQMLQSAVRSREPETDEQKIKPIGYSARREISVTINDLNTFEAIYRGLIERGVNEVDNLTFHSSEIRTHRDAARLQAVAAAREKATAMAEALQCRLASVQSIRETSPGWRGSNVLQNRISIAPDDDAAGLGSGMITISASVDVVFLLGNTDLDP
jgi:uncharacterized protein YggE